MFLWKAKKNFILGIILLLITVCLVSVIIFFNIRSADSKNVSAFQGNSPNNIKVIKNNDANDFSDIVFINSSEGWKLSYLDCAMFSQTSKLYKTNDGGKTWKEINNTDSSLPLPTKTGITFLDSNTGWITTSGPTDFIGIYKTADGGLTWALQKITTSKKYKLCMYETCPPVFFSKEDGVLLITPVGQADKYYGKLVYITHDKGQNWAAVSENSTNDDLKWIYDNDTWKITFRNTIWESIDGYLWSVSK